MKADILVRQNDFDDIIRFYKRTKPSLPVKTGIISPQSRRKVEFTHPKAHKLHSMWQNGKFPVSTVDQNVHTQGQQKNFSLVDGIGQVT